MEKNRRMLNSKTSIHENVKNDDVFYGNKANGSPDVFYENKAIGSPDVFYENKANGSPDVFYESKADGSQIVAICFSNSF